jgi:hypothetical protein
MRVFVYEYTCAEPSRIAPSLHSEGWAMLSAIVEDFRCTPNVEVVTLLAPSVPDMPLVQIHRIAGNSQGLFQELAGRSDYSLIIAPESGGILQERCRWVEEAGGRLLGPSADAVRLTADKLALGGHLHDRGVPTPPCRPVSGALPGLGDFPAVCKPRHGAGSQATYLLQGSADVAACPARAAAEGYHGELLLQPFIPGQPVSVAFLMGPRQVLPLAPAEQDLSTDGRFRYLGGRLPLRPDLAARAVALGHRALAGVPGLLGYVGVDLVLGAAADGSTDAVLEINPRLTTSYIGLRRLAWVNLAAVLLGIVQGKETGRVEWRSTEVTFSSDGAVKEG